MRRRRLFVLWQICGCNRYQTQKREKKKSLKLEHKASDSSIPVCSQPVKSVVTANNYCHNISNQQTQTAWKLLLSKYVTCEILWHSGRKRKSTENEQLQQWTDNSSDMTAEILVCFISCPTFESYQSSWTEVNQQILIGLFPSTCVLWYQLTFCVFYSLG